MVKLAIQSTAVELPETIVVLQVGKVYRHIKRGSRHELICVIGDSKDHNDAEIVLKDIDGICWRSKAYKFAKEHVYDSHPW